LTTGKGFISESYSSVLLRNTFRDAYFIPECIPSQNIIWRWIRSLCRPMNMFGRIVGLRALVLTIIGYY